MAPGASIGVGSDTKACAVAHCPQVRILPGFAEKVILILLDCIHNPHVVAQLLTRIESKHID